MSSEINLTNSCSDDFKLVTYKKSKRRELKSYAKTESHVPSSSFICDQSSVLRRVQSAKEDILVSDFYASLVASLREGWSLLHQPKVVQIVCLGLGKSLYTTSVSVCDPIFDNNDRLILESFGFNILDGNVEGKLPVDPKETVLFYLPHCPKQLSNNLLWANWGLQLSCCVIIANSFTQLLETNSQRTLLKNAQYILAVSPYVVELAVINTFKIYEIFNDTAIHVFPPDKLGLVPQDFWKANAEPKYTEEDIEFIRSPQTKCLGTIKKGTTAHLRPMPHMIHHESTAILPQVLEDTGKKTPHQTFCINLL